MTLTVLPPPRWHGFPAWTDMVRQWGEFVVQQQVERANDAPRRAQEALDEAIATVQGANGSLTYAREQMQQVRDLVQSLTDKLEEFGRDDAAQRERAEALMALPFVIGTRLEWTGELAVQIRVTGQWLGQPADVGDFDVSLREHDQASSVVTLRYPKSTGGRSLPTQGLSRSRWHDIIPEGMEGTVRGVNREDETVESYLQKAHDTFAKSTESWYIDLHGGVTPAPEPGWSEFVSVESTARALATMDRKAEERMRNRLAQKQRAVINWQEEEQRCLDMLREARRQERIARAKLDEINAEAKAEVVVNPAEWVDDLHKIAVFPGVMGMKFVDGIPVVHVRTSTVYRNQRYDMGDYEIHLKLHKHEHPAALGMAKTRNITNRYWHDEAHPWFCYGGRAGQIMDLFKAGHYPAMVHLAINTLNEVNAGDQRGIPSYFNEIAMDLVWQNIVRPVDEPVEEGAEETEGVEQPAQLVIETPEVPEAPEPEATEERRDPLLAYLNRGDLFNDGDIMNRRIRRDDPEERERRQRRMREILGDIPAVNMEEILPPLPPLPVPPEVPDGFRVPDFADIQMGAHWHGREHQPMRDLFMDFHRPNRENINMIEPPREMRNENEHIDERPRRERPQRRPRTAIQRMLDELRQEEADGDQTEERTQFERQRGIAPRRRMWRG